VSELSRHVSSLLKGLNRRHCSRDASDDSSFLSRFEFKIKEYMKRKKKHRLRVFGNVTRMMRMDLEWRSSSLQPPQLENRNVATWCIDTRSLEYDGGDAYSVGIMNVNLNKFINFNLAYFLFVYFCRF